MKPQTAVCLCCAEVVVAPRAGARIETLGPRSAGAGGRVAPRAGARIETARRCAAGFGSRTSPPARGRGLKLGLLLEVTNSVYGRPPRGGAD